MGITGGYYDSMIFITYENDILFGNCKLKDNKIFEGQDEHYEINNGIPIFEIEDF